MKLNYKITSIVLIVFIIISYVYHLDDNLFRKYYDGAYPFPRSQGENWIRNKDICIGYVIRKSAHEGVEDAGYENLCIGYLKTEQIKMVCNVDKPETCY